MGRGKKVPIFFFLEAVALPAQGACSVIMQSKGPSATCNNREITWLSRGTRELSPALETRAPQQGLIRFWFSSTGKESQEHKAGLKCNLCLSGQLAKSQLCSVQSLISKHRYEQEIRHLLG